MSAVKDALDDTIEGVKEALADAVDTAKAKVSKTFAPKRRSTHIQPEPVYKFK